MGPVQRAHIEAAIRDKYRKVATGRAGQFKYPTGTAGLAGLGYEQSWLASLPGPVLECFCGVGNPFSLDLPRQGARVLDIGCGCGVDTLIAAFLAGPDGLAVGVEAIQEMLATARENARAARAENTGFVEGSAESLPFRDGAFDLLISSGVFNLVIEKELALSEAFRVLKPGGRIQVADQALTGPPPTSVGEAVASWFT
jgi:SAM-dependent methyltransferase